MTELTDPSDYATILASSNPDTLLIYRSPDPSYSLSDNSDPSSSSSSSSSPLTPQENPTMSIPANLLKGLRPDTFNGRYRDNRAEDWLVRFERYCRLANIAETGQDRVLYAGMLMTDGASRWYEQLGTITETTVDGRTLSPYQVFKNKFRQRFMNANDAEDAFDQIRDLRQK
ncbi:hypothetical protein MVEG_08498 [Podila verticillata NRRL 6337]|nr:hypothetical protein MVEG_08498 [Podila verticillata NRRL 6337]